jgi:hypothetical protein
VDLRMERANILHLRGMANKNQGETPLVHL